MAPSRCGSVMKHADDSKSEASELLQILDGRLSTVWKGQKGETYEICSSAPGSWSCTRWGTDGSKKPFSLWLDNATGLVWWGSWTYYFDPKAFAKSPRQISWHAAHGGIVKFVWTCEKTPVPVAQTPSVKTPVPQTPSVMMAARKVCEASQSQSQKENIDTHQNSMPKQAEAEADAKTCDSSYFSPQLGLAGLPKGFQAPPGLEPPPGLELVHERRPHPWARPQQQPRQKQGKNKMTSPVRLQEVADDETSAGSAADSDSEQSEAEEVTSKVSRRQVLAR